MELFVGLNVTKTDGKVLDWTMSGTVAAAQETFCQAYVHSISLGSEGSIQFLVTATFPSFV